MKQDEYHLRQEIVKIGQLMYQKGLISASEGNISARLDANRLLITPSGLHKGLMDTDHILVIDETGQMIGPRPGAARKLKPTSELSCAPASMSLVTPNRSSWAPARWTTSRSPLSRRSSRTPAAG